MIRKMDMIQDCRDITAETMVKDYNVREYEQCSCYPSGERQHQTRVTSRSLPSLSASPHTFHPLHTLSSHPIPAVHPLLTPLLTHPPSSHPIPAIHPLLTHPPSSHTPFQPSTLSSHLSPPTLPPPLHTPSNIRLGWSATVPASLVNINPSIRDFPQRGGEGGAEEIMEEWNDLRQRYPGILISCVTTRFEHLNEFQQLRQLNTIMF
ncbi:hypothetical protein Pcinc_039384 [Petrolisthes cinctipes]|uniref:Uncharacterized protein n=1 Tax=Petrolisthes cinctipes TaxID=88211 RepID=A0AAE1EJK3_PETCI|nr:hypothetical protein Pcinc_039384 [Petrolisthes cinctipes]